MFNQGQHFTVIMYIHKRVVTERGGRVYEVEYDNLIPFLLQQIPGLTQNFGLWIRNYHRAGTFQHIRYTVGACLAFAGAADNEDVGVIREREENGMRAKLSNLQSIPQVVVLQ